MTERGSPDRLAEAAPGVDAVMSLSRGTLPVSVDAITGEGLCLLGFRQALALADAFAREDPALDASAHRRQGRRPGFMADFMLTLDRSPWLRARALPALASHPDLFRSLLAMHVGAAQPQAFAVSCLVRSDGKS